MSRTIEVFTVKEVKYEDQYGFKRTEKVKDHTMTLTMTDRTKDSKYYDSVIKAPIAEDELGLEYVGSVATDFGPSHKAWTGVMDGQVWYSRWAGNIGGEWRSPIDPKTAGVVG